MASMSERWRVVASGPWEHPGWDRPFREAGVELIQGISFDEQPGEAYIEDELIDLLRDADALLVSTRDTITRRVMEHCPRLKIIAKSTIGVERIDLDSAADLGIVVVNSPAPENFLGVAEATIGLIMVLTKQMPAIQQRLREGKWKDPTSFGRMLRGDTVGIVGLGRIGMNVARRLTGWDVRLLAADPYVEPAVAIAVGAELVPLDKLIRESDVVTVHVVLTEETRGIIGEAQLRAMKSTAYLVNTSRGPAVDQAALVRAIEEGWIAGAALDVFEDEPLPQDNPLRRLDPNRMILTPHSIGNNLASHDTGTEMAIGNILRALRGEVPSYIRNPAALARWKDRFKTPALA